MKNKLFFPVFVSLFFSVVLSSCSVLFSSQKSVSFHPETPGVEIEVSNYHNKFILGDQTALDAKSQSGNIFKLSNYVDLHLVKQTKEGYKTKVTPIYKTKFNTMKLLDIGVPVVGGLIYAGHLGAYSDLPSDYDPYYDNDPRNEAKNKAALYSGGAMALALYYGPWRVYASDFDLPALTPLPVRNENERYLMVNHTELKVGKEDYDWLYYHDFKAYQEGDSYYNSKGEEDLDFESDKLTYELNKLLGSYGYKDSINTLFVNTFKNLELQCRIEKIREHKINSLTALGLTANWKLMDMSTEVDLVNRTLEADSYIIANSELENTESAKALFLDAVETSLIEFITLKEVREHLRSFTPAFLSEYENWDEIYIASDAPKVRTIKEASEAVVTIKTDKWHGSGCVISENGFIVTNHHVVNKAEKIEVIMENGVTMEATLVRANPLLDLALLSVEEKLKVRPFDMAELNAVELGAEVFSIGTPQEMELGQTLAKGIVSAKRKIEDRIYIQTDASINGGNSGGALIGTSGQLFGVVNAKLIGVGVEGIGFAIPAAYLEEALKIKIGK